MNIQELQAKYIAFYNNLRNKGVKNKILMLLLLVPAILYSYLVLERKYYLYHWDKFMPHNRIVMITIGVAFFLILIILTIKSFSFINTRKSKSFKYYFKKELFDCLKKEIPEIMDYIHNQKIHPKIFYKSNLFKSKHSDYIGDDWIKGRIGETTFEMCELHVFSLFQNIFSGIFIRIKTNNRPFNIAENVSRNNIHITKFEKKHQAKVLTSQNPNEIFVAIKMNGKFFEADNTKMINSADDGMVMLREIVDLIKIIAVVKKY